MKLSSLKQFVVVFTGGALLALGSMSTARAQAFNLYGAPQAANGAFYQVNPGTGALTTVTTGTGAFYAGMDTNPITKTLYAAGGSFLYTVDPTTGQPITTTRITIVGNSDLGIYSLSFSPSGVLYGLANGNGNLYIVDPLTGIATFVGGSGDSIYGLEFSANGTLYGCGTDFYQINPLNGSATDLGTLVTTGLAANQFALFTDLDYAPNGVMYGVTTALSFTIGSTIYSNTDSLYSINLTTANATLIGKTGGNLDAIASVPEPGPGSWVLVAGGGFAAWGCLHRRKVA